MAASLASASLASAQDPSESAGVLGESTPGSSAAPAAATPGPASDEEPPGAPGAADPAREEAGWSHYDNAVSAQRDGRRRAARDLFERFLLQYPGHPAEARAQALREQLDVELATSRGSTAASQGREDTSTLARAEFVTSQSLLGTTYGVVPCVIGGCSGARPWVLASLAGVGAGLGISLLYSRDGITPGASYTMNTGALWGLGMGYLLTATFGRFYDESHEYDYSGFDPGDRLALGMMLGQLGGLGVGALLNATLQPTAGEAALASSAGTWAVAVVALFSLAAASNGLSERGIRGLHAGLVAAAVLSMGLGGYLGHRHEMTRGRVLLMDLGAGLGGALAVALGFLFGGNGVSAEGMLVGAGVGVLTGVVAAGYLTRGLRVTPTHDINVQLGPTRGGATLGVHARF